MSGVADSATENTCPSRSTNAMSDEDGRRVVAVVCAGCGAKIADRYYFAAVGRRWHLSCLRCYACAKQLDPATTSYAKNERVYCRDDFRRLFMCRECPGCQQSISADDMVMAVVIPTQLTSREGHVLDGSARPHVAVYHMHCFRCVACGDHRGALVPGEQYGVDDNRIYCRAHFCELKLILGRRAPLSTPCNVSSWCRSSKPAGIGGYKPTGATRGRPRKIKLAPEMIPPPLVSPPSDAPQQQTEDDSTCSVRETTDIEYNDGEEDTRLRSDISAEDALLDDASSSTGQCGSWEEPTESGGELAQTVRRKRMRSSFKHHQLKVMKAYFQVNHNPDAKELREISIKTGLLTRVIQVWFQNARAKYRRNLHKQQQQQALSNHVVPYHSDQHFDNQYQQTSGTFCQPEIDSHCPHQCNATPPFYCRHCDVIEPATSVRISGLVSASVEESCEFYYR